MHVFEWFFVWIGGCMMFRKFLGIFLMLIMSHSAVYGYNASDDLTEVFQKIEAKKVKIREQLSHLPAQVEQEASAVILRLDEYWASDRARHFTKEFLEQAKKKAETVHLSEKYGTVETLIAEYESLVSAEKLNAIAGEYIQDVASAIVHGQDELFTKLRTGMTLVLSEAFQEAQHNLASRIDSLMASEFKYWPDCFTTIPIVAPDVQNTASVKELPGTPGWRTVVGGGLVATSLMKKIGGRIVGKVRQRVARKAGQKVSKKVAGKVAGKFIPFVGPILLGLDAYDAVTARTRMEEFLRGVVLQQYAAEMRPSAIWRGSINGGSIRENVLSDVRSQLSSWAEQTSEIAYSFLDTAILLENPTFQTFIEQKHQEGWSMVQISDYCSQLKSIFGPLCKEAPSVDMLVNMMVLAPSRTDLSRLSDALGRQIFPLYQAHGRLILNAGADLGPDLLARLLRTGEDWKKIHRLFSKHLSGSSSKQAREGLMFCIQKGIDPNQVDNPEFYARVIEHRSLVMQLVQGKVGQVRIADVLADKESTGLLESCLPRAPGLVVPLVDNLPLTRLARYTATHRGKALIEAFIVCRSMEMTAEQFTLYLKESDRLIGIYEEYGSIGLDIHFSYIKRHSGSVQKEWAEKALSLYEKGCPVHICKDKENIKMSSFYYSFPGGKQIYDFLYPMIQNIPVIAHIVLFSILVLILCTPYFVYSRLINKRHKDKKKKKNGFENKHAKKEYHETLNDKEKNYE